MSLTHRIARSLVLRFCITVVLIATISALLPTTDAEVGAVSATEDFGNCFGGPTEDICLWGVIQKNESVLITTLILIVMAAYSLVLIAERWLTIAIARSQSLKYQLRVCSTLYHDRFEEAAALSAEYPKSPVALAVDAFIRSNVRIRSASESPSMQEWHRAIVIKSAEIKRRIWMLGAIGWSAPLVGMLYASTRITQTLGGWYAAEGTSFAPFAGEIASGVWGVSFSIVVAVPAIWGYRYFSAQAEMTLLEMEKLSLAVIEHLFNRRTVALSPAPSAFYITQELNKNATRRLAR